MLFFRINYVHQLFKHLKKKLIQNPSWQIDEITGRQKIIHRGEVALRTHK